MEIAMTEKKESKLVTLKEICAELKLEPREAREKLRVGVRDKAANPNLAKARQPGQPWQWHAGSAELAEVRKLLASSSAAPAAGA